MSASSGQWDEEAWPRSDGYNLPDLPVTPKRVQPAAPDAPQTGRTDIPISPARRLRTPQESSTFEYSSPHIGTRAQIIAKNRRAGAVKRRKTMELNQQELDRHRAELEREKEAAARKQDEQRLEQLRDVCLAVLQVLKNAGIVLGDFLLFVLDPEMREQDMAMRRWAELFLEPAFLNKILHNWTSSSRTPASVRQRVQDWMVAHIAGITAHEAAAITKSGWLRGGAKEMSAKNLLAFRLEEVYPRFQQEAPVMLKICESFATTPRQAQNMTATRLRLRRMMLAQVMASLMRQRSRANSRVACHNGLYLYASGAQRQTISVLSHLGYCCSYTTLVRKRHRPRQPKKEAADVQSEDGGESDPSQEAPDIVPAQEAPDNVPAKTSADELYGEGILPALSESCLREARVIAATGEYEGTYDNVNFTDSISEQIVARTDAQQNMTNAAVIDFHPDTKDAGAALSVESADETFLAAPPLTIQDIIMSREEAKLWVELNVSTVEHEILDYGEDRFTHFRASVISAEPRDVHQLQTHKTTIYPLQTMDIDESTITGNVDVVNNIHMQLGLDLDSPAWARRIRLFFGDQLTIARQRSIIGARAGHESGAEGWHWAKPIPALFHTDMAAVSCILSAHWGQPDTGARNPCSLWFHNTVLHRKPIVLTSTPPFQVCRSLIFVSLRARVLHCLLKVTAQPDLVASAASIKTYQEFHSYAQTIYRTYASISKVVELRNQRRKGGRGDKVFENASLFLRDALGLRTFGRLVKSGQSGHIILALKWLAMTFKAGGHPKYAREMLYLVHHMSRVWPKGLRDLVLQNWLVNPTGTANGWVALDLMQEHLNFWIKRMYAAHGSNASWEWLAMISPCIDVLRKVASQVHASLGSHQGRKHTSPDLTRDIRVLMASLDEHRVYEVGAERKGVDESEIELIPDLWGVGVAQMTDGANATLTEYNAAFKTLQARCRVKPLQDFVPQAAAAPGALARASGEVETESSAGAEASTQPDTLSAITARQTSNDHAAGGERERMAVDRDTNARDEGGCEEESVSGESRSDTPSSTGDADEDLDDLFLSLADEADVSLDADGDWEEESSGEESGAGEDDD